MIMTPTTRAEKKKGLFLLVLALLFISVFAYVVFAVQEISTVTLNSTFGTNLTSENLTAYVNPLNASQKYIYNWKKDGSSITVLNMPMDGGTLAENNTKVK